MLYFVVKYEWFLFSPSYPCNSTFSWCFVVSDFDLHQDYPERNNKPNVAKDHLSYARGEKPKQVLEITLVRSEEKARVTPQKHFSSSHSSRCKILTKIPRGSGVLISTTQAHYEVFHLYYWIQLSNEIPIYKVNHTTRSLTF